MADEEKKRIVQYQEASDFRNDDYALIDNSITGTRKIKVDGKLVKVTDVQVDNTTVMDGSIAKIDLSGKQDVLTPGANVQINGNTISATDTTYTAGTNVQISDQNVISATDTTYSEFSGSSAGLVPAVTTQTGNYLRDDGTWATPSGGGGGGGSTVIITPTLNSGTQIATASVNGVPKTLYAPNPTSVTVTPQLSSGTPIGKIVVDAVESQLYAPNSGSTVSVNQVLSSGTKIATLSIDSNSTDIFAPAGGESVSVTQLQSTGTAIATVTVGSTATDIYAPPSGSMVQISNTQPSGTTLATLTIDGNATDIKMPAGSNLVDQVPTGTDAAYEILFAGSTGNTAYTGGVGKYVGFDYNPSDKQLSVWEEYAVSTVTKKDAATILPSSISVEYSENDVLTNKLSIDKSDITLTGSTWDGTNASLKTALSGKLNTSGGTITGNITLSDATIITPGSTTYGIRPATADKGFVGTSSYPFDYVTAGNLKALTLGNNNSWNCMTMSSSDITFTADYHSTADTWDGENTSLKTALSSMFKTKTFTITYTNVTGSWASYIASTDWQIAGYTCLGLIRWSSEYMYVCDVRIDYGSSHEILINVDNPSSLPCSGDATYTFLYVHTGCVTEL